MPNKETPFVFDRIGPSWYNFRHFTIFRPELEELAHKWESGKLLNLGCGHGADFLPFANGNFELYGVDSSAEMLKLAEKYADKFNFKVNLYHSDVTNLPSPDATFDWAISVATYHHLKTKEERLKALQELYRILKPGGEAFITVWNRTQPRFLLKGKEILVPWKLKDETLYRYYYLFTYPELTKLVKESGFTVLKVSPEKSHKGLKLFSRNICLLAKK